MRSVMGDGAPCDTRAQRESRTGQAGAGNANAWLARGERIPAGFVQAMEAA